jgi:predicted ATPase
MDEIAQTIGAKDGLAPHIGEREMLLLLDNLEQVIEAAPDLSGLLQTCPYLTLLCTSRELLRVQGEVEYEVPPLASSEAVSLFCERSRLEPSEEIPELCARLDNLPLAVELAAARTKALSPAQILERLSQRLDLLKGGRDADPRQQTLRTTIQWSYDLLSIEEQRLFRALSVFSGGCTLEAAEEVADASLDTLQSLVEKSLLRFTDSRYWMLETIREYAGGAARGGGRRWAGERAAPGLVRLPRRAGGYVVAWRRPNVVRPSRSRERQRSSRGRRCPPAGSDRRGTAPRNASLAILGRARTRRRRRAGTRGRA